MVADLADHHPADLLDLLGLPGHGDPFLLDLVLQVRPAV